MIITVALILSVLFQFSAFFITISLIRKTKFNISWIALSVGFALMAFRRLLVLIDISNNPHSHIEDNFDSWIAVIISLLMFIASFYIRQIFRLQSKINNLRKESQTKILSAIIKTEERERQKFAKELHDGLGPILSSIKMSLSAIDKSIMNPKNELIIDKTEMAVDNAIISIKEISNNLSPHILERFGLEKAIKTFTDTIVTCEKLNILVSSNLNGKRYNYNIEVVIYRVIGELITNTLKHASASNVDISLFNYPNKLELFYSDNGIGFKINNIDSSGMGLVNINSRVKSLNGSVDMYSKPKQGFFIKVTIPL